VKPGSLVLVVRREIEREEDAMSKEVMRSQYLERLTAAVDDVKKTYRSNPGAPSVADLTSPKPGEPREKR
jgi:hypothetical protein